MLNNCKDKGRKGRHFSQQKGKIRKNSHVDIFIKQHICIAAPQIFSAAFKRILDPELPEDQLTKLVVDSKIRQDAEGAWWFSDFEFDTIYVNGSNNLPNLQQEGDTWKVRLTEEEFMKRMWDVEV